MNGAPEVEAAAAPARLLTPHQPRPHAMGEALGERVRLRDLPRIDDVTQIGDRPPRGGGRLAGMLAPLGGCVAGLAVAGLDLILRRRRAWLVRRLGEALQRRPMPAQRARRLHAPHAAALPEGGKDFLEALPIRARGAEQTAQRRHQQRGPEGCRRGEDGKRVARLGEADGEAVVAQRPHEAGEPPAQAGADRRRGLELGGGRHQATRPSRRSVTSRVRRARSSWVLSTQISVSCTASGACRRS